MSPVQVLTPTESKHSHWYLSKELGLPVANIRKVQMGDNSPGCAWERIQVRGLPGEFDSIFCQVSALSRFFPKALTTQLMGPCLHMFCCSNMSVGISGYYGVFVGIIYWFSYFIHSGGDMIAIIRGREGWLNIKNHLKMGQEGFYREGDPLCDALVSLKLAPDISIQHQPVVQNSGKEIQPFRQLVQAELGCTQVCLRVVNEVATKLTLLSSQYLTFQSSPRPSER